MTSTALVKRPSGGSTTNAEGFQVAGWTTVYTGLPMRLGGSDRGGAGSRSVVVGDVELALAVRVASFPYDTANLRDGDVVEVTAGENAGAFLRIVEASWQDQATARRVPVIEAQKPEGWA